MIQFVADCYVAWRLLYLMCYVGREIWDGLKPYKPGKEQLKW